MNPYLEHDDAWHNFHEQFPAAVVAMLEPQVGPNYFLRVDEHIYIHELPDEQRRLLGRSDVSVGRTSGAEVGGRSQASAVLAPRQVLLPTVETEGLSYVEIRDRRNRRLVTVIELLSPSNKQPGPDRDQYETKRAEVLVSRTHLVEIDLLRGGGRMPFAEEVQCDYCVLVSRAEKRPRADLWSFNLGDPLPQVPVPLAEDSADVQLDLQVILHRLYDAGGYAKFIYDSQPHPPLRPEDAAWALTFVPGSARQGG
jgi:hypothetical protein